MLLASIADTALNVVKVVVGIGLLILIHELGHFMVGKLLGVRIFRLSVGFGKPLLGFRRGETEYVLSALPLGGYVKFAGETPGEQRTTDPRALSNQSAGRRALIFVAGAVMNVVGALVMFIVAFQVGVEFVVAKAGQVHPEGPAFEADIRQGDEILEINGRRMLDFMDVQAAVALSDPSRDMHIVVLRDGQRKTFTLRPRVDDRLQKGVPTIGIGRPLSTYIGAVEEGSEAEAAGLKPGDHILAIQVDTAPEKTLNTFSELMKAIQSAGDRPVLLEVAGPGGTTRWQRVRARREVLQYRLPWQLGPVSVRAVVKDSPAAGAGIQRGDAVLTAAGKPVLSSKGLVEIIGAHGERPMAIAVRRDKKQLTFTVTPRTEKPDTSPKIGVVPGMDPKAVPQVLHVRPDSKLAEAGIPEGSVVLKVNDTPCETVGDVEKALAPILAKALKDPDQRVRLTLRTPDGRPPYPVKEVAPEPLGEEYSLGIWARPATQVARYGVGEACVVGLRKTVTSLRQILLTLRRIIFTRSVKPADAFTGPVGIADIAYKQAKSGFGDFVFLLAILGANLAVINLLPIPILDGGQLLLLGVEKVKGSPLSERAQVLAQYLGLTLIVLLLAYVVLQDVTKVIQ